MGPRRPAARPPEPRALDWVAALLVGQLALVAFLPALRAEFVLWDDDTNFLKNTAWRGLGWAELEWMFTTPHKGQWIPLTWITLGLDYLLLRLQPRGFHLTSLVFPAANAPLGPHVPPSSPPPSLAFPAANAPLVSAVARRLLARALPDGGEALRL